MIEPNFNLMLWLLLISFLLRSIAGIVLGAAGHKKRNYYDAIDIIGGVINIIIVIIIVVT